MVLACKVVLPRASWVVLKMDAEHPVRDLPGSVL